MGCSSSLFGGARQFATNNFKTKFGDTLSSDFSFPRHKELFNDEYYNQDDGDSPYQEDAEGPWNHEDDTADVDSPF